MKFKIRQSTTKSGAFQKPQLKIFLAERMIGVTPMSRYAQLIDNTWWNHGTFDHSSPRTIAQVYLDIVKGKKTDLSIIDFSIGIEGDGPSIGLGGKTINMKERLGSWAIIASTDIACTPVYLT